MANPFGSGTALVIPLPSRPGHVPPVEPEPMLDETSTVRVRGPKGAPQPPVDDPPEVSTLLKRITGLLTAREDGLTAQELRAELNERPENLQRALAAGLRARRLRRSGSRCRLRYLLNA